MDECVIRNSLVERENSLLVDKNRKKKNIPDADDDCGRFCGCVIGKCLVTERKDS